MEYKISIIPHRKAKFSIPKTFTYEELKGFFSEFLKSSKEEAQAFISGHFRENRRLTENLESKQLIVLDLDENPANSEISHLEGVFRRNLDPYRYIAYSTGSFSSTAFKIRILLFLEKSVEAKDYKTVSSNFISTFEKEFQELLDLPASISPNHSLNLPIIPHDDYNPWYESKDGKLINPDDYREGINCLSPIHGNPIDTEDQFDLTIAHIPLSITTEEILTTLQEYNAVNTDYYSWLQVGQALHHQYRGQDKGLSIWNKWSSKDTRTGQYQGLKYLRSKWDSFSSRSDNPVTFATVIYRLNSLKPEKVKKQKKINTPQVKQNDQCMLSRDIWAHTRGEKQTPKFTEANFQILLKSYGIEISFDSIKKEMSISINGVRESNINSAVTKIKMFAELNDMKTSPVNEAVHLTAHNNVINTWKAWIESTPWDGKDRFSSFCESVLVSPENIEVRNLYLKKWLLQMLHVSCLNDDEIAKTARMVLIFNGKQHIGKTSWFRALVPLSMKDYIIEGKTLNVADSMDVLSCITHVMVELGEMASTIRKSDQEQLKNFLSSTKDILNIKYIAHPVSYKRSTVFFGSVNDTTFLQDQTGNTRFLTLSVQGCNAEHGIDMQQLYVQLLEEAKITPNYNLSLEDLKRQQALNVEFENISALEEKFIEIFEIEGGDKDKVYTATKVLEELGFNITQITPKKSTINEMARILDNYGFKRSKHPRGWYLPSRKMKEAIL